MPDTGFIVVMSCHERHNDAVEISTVFTARSDAQRHARTVLDDPENEWRSVVVLERPIAY